MLTLWEGAGWSFLWGSLTCLLLSVAGLINTFRVFGSLSVEWPGKDGKHPRCPPKGNMPKGNSEHGRATFFPMLCYSTDAGMVQLHAGDWMVQSTWGNVLPSLGSAPGLQSTGPPKPSILTHP